MLHFSCALNGHLKCSFILEWSANSCEQSHLFMAVMIPTSCSSSTNHPVSVLEWPWEHRLWTFKPNGFLSIMSHADFGYRTGGLSCLIFGWFWGLVDVSTSGHVLLLVQEKFFLKWQHDCETNVTQGVCFICKSWIPGLPRSTRTTRVSKNLFLFQQMFRCPSYKSRFWL